MAEQQLEATIIGAPLPGRPFPRLPEAVTPQDEGAGIGEGLQQAGQIAAQQEMHADRTRAIGAVNQQSTWVNSALYDPQNGLMNKQGANAVNLAPQFLSQYDEQNEKISDGLANDRQREMFRQKTAEERPLIEAQLMRHENEQMNAHADQTAGALIATAQQGAALNFNDPQIIAKSLSDVDLSLQTTADRKGWSPEELQQQQQAHFSQLHMGVVSAMLDHDRLPEAQQYLAKVRDVLSPAQAAKADDWISEGQVRAAGHAITAAYAQDTSQGARAMAALPKSDLTPDQQIGVVKMVEQARTALTAERRQQYQKPLMALEEAIDSGHPPDDARAQVQNLWHKGVYTDDQAASTMGRVDRAKEEQDKKLAALNDVDQAFQNRTPLDAKNPDVKKNVDLGFRQMTGGIQPGTPEFTNRAVSWAERTGVVPESAVSWSRANLISGDPKSAAQAADLVAKIAEANPHVPIFGEDSKTTAIASTINLATRAGMNPQKAVEMARSNAELGEDAQNVLNQRWIEKVGEKAKADLSQSNALQAHLKADPTFTQSGWFSKSTPTIPPAMQGDFDTLTKSYYRYTQGDINQARDLAARDLKHVWGVSEVNGSRQIMPYAPESMFPGLKASDVRSDIADTVAKNAAAFPAKLDASKVSLIPDPVRTARTNGRQWNLGAPDEFGMRDVVRDANGDPIVYQIPALNYQDLRAQEFITHARELKATQDRIRDMTANRTPGRLTEGTWSPRADVDSPELDAQRTEIEKANPPGRLPIAGAERPKEVTAALAKAATPEQQAWLDKQVSQDKVRVQ